MPNISKIEQEIRSLEGFDVSIRSDKSGLTARKRIPSYLANHERKARQSHTVADWKRLRFEVDYPDLEVDVLDVSGKKVAGKMSLERLRSMYE
jgi:hypothetical protein